MLWLPEQKIKYLIDYFLNSLTEDYLYRLFGDQTFGNGYNYYDNAKALLLKTSDNPRKVVSNIFFNRDRQNLPTIHIALNQDIPGEGNGLGFDLSEEVNSAQTGYENNTSRIYSARFNIICTSDNSFEVLIMYNVLRAFMQGNVQLLEYLGFANVKFSGQDLVLTDYLMPSTIYARGFIIDTLYEITTPGLELQSGITEAFVSSLCARETKINE